MSDSGSGFGLPKSVLIVATACSLLSTVLSIWAIWLQLKNVLLFRVLHFFTSHTLRVQYRKIHLQRWVVRIMVMVPVYSISSAISLYSSEAAFFVDALRDIYEAFVIYCFFSLLVEYLGGERSLIILLHGRPPTPHVFPVNFFSQPIDLSDPFAFLGLKRGILQYVQLKPILAGITMILKALGKYQEGTLKKDNGYTYISVVYNISVALSLYCLVLFWSCTHDDLKPYRPLPKFICVKGIIFATFWQSFLISILVSTGALKSDVYSKEDFSLAITDALICIEMPFFAVLHLYAFSHKDYIDPNNLFSGRMPFYYAVRDCLFGFKDVLQDSLTTFRGTGFSYRTFEPAEGGVHQGQARDRRVRAGLRYAKGGQAKYWLPMPGAETGEAYGRKKATGAKTDWKDWVKNPLDETRKKLEEERKLLNGYAPLSPEQAADVVHTDPAELESALRTEGRWEDDAMIRQSGPAVPDEASSDSSIEFSDPEEEDEELFDDARKLEFGDYNSPVVDASREAARRRIRDEEDQIVHNKRFKGKSVDKVLDKVKRINEPTIAAPAGQKQKRYRTKKSSLPDGCVDLMVEDEHAEEEADGQARLKGDINQLGGRQRKIFRRVYKSKEGSSDSPDATAEHAGAPSVDVDGEAFEVSVDRDPEHADAQAQGAVKTGDVKLARESSEDIPNFIEESGLQGESRHDGDVDNPWHEE